MQIISSLLCIPRAQGRLKLEIVAGATDRDDVSCAASLLGASHSCAIGARIAYRECICVGGMGINVHEVEVKPILVSPCQCQSHQICVSTWLPTSISAKSSRAVGTLLIWILHSLPCIRYTVAVKGCCSLDVWHDVFKYDLTHMLIPPIFGPRPAVDCGRGLSPKCRRSPCRLRA